MGKPNKKISQKKEKDIINVLNFQKDSYFFYFTKIYSCTQNIQHN